MAIERDNVASNLGYIQARKYKWHFLHSKIINLMSHGCLWLYCQIKTVSYRIDYGYVKYEIKFPVLKRLYYVFLDEHFTYWDIFSINLIFVLNDLVWYV